MILTSFSHGLRAILDVGRVGLKISHRPRFDGYISQAFAYLDEPWTRGKSVQFREKNLGTLGLLPSIQYLGDWI